MIYVYFDKLANMTNQESLDKLSLKSMIYEYRNRILSQFCAACHLPAPMYAKQSDGKPIITNSRLVFNQSHSDESYALAFSLSVRELGVDTESIHRQANFDALARRFFHADEYTLWRDNGCDRVLWLKLWTIKEAVLKANGLGIRMNLNELNAKFINAHQGEIFHRRIGHYRFECIVKGDDIATIAYVSDAWQAWRFY